MAFMVILYVKYERKAKVITCIHNVRGYDVRGNYQGGKGLTHGLHRSINSYKFFTRMMSNGGCYSHGIYTLWKWIKDYDLNLKAHFYQYKSGPTSISNQCCRHYKLSASYD